MAEWLRRWTWNPLGFPAQVRILPMSFFFILDNYIILIIDYGCIESTKSLRAADLPIWCILRSLITFQTYRSDFTSSKIRSFNKKSLEWSDVIIDISVLFMRSQVKMPQILVTISTIPKSNPSWCLAPLVEPTSLSEGQLLWLMVLPCSFDASYTFQSTPLRFQQSLNETLPDVLLLW